MPTPSMEDYLERIYLLMVEKGYARVSDIAEHLGVHPSSVTKMVQKLDREDGVDEAHVYEDVEGIEHHLSSNTLDCMTQFVEFFEDKPELMAQFRAFQDVNRSEDE